MGKTSNPECYKECGRYSHHYGFKIPHGEHCASITNANRLMFIRKSTFIIYLHGTHKHTNRVLTKRKAFSVKRNNTNSDQWA